MLVDHLAAGDIDQRGTLGQRGKGLPSDESLGLWGPLTANRHELSRLQQAVKLIRTADLIEAGWKFTSRRAASPHDPHAQPGAQPPDILSDTAGSNDTDRLAGHLNRPVGKSIEFAGSCIDRCLIQPTREVEERGDNVFGNGQGVPEPARCGDDNITTPQVTTEKIAGARRSLVKPPELGRPRT